MTRFSQHDQPFKPILLFIYFFHRHTHLYTHGIKEQD